MLALIFLKNDFLGDFESPHAANSSAIILISPMGTLVLSSLALGSFRLSAVV